MIRISIGTIGLLALALTSCAKPEDRITEVPNGKFKIDIRYREYLKSGTVNIDVCVADRASNEFPTDHGQCFLHGFHFNSVSVKWVSDSNAVITFDCGRVTTYQNSALITADRKVPDAFNAKLNDTCHTYVWAN